MFREQWKVHMILFYVNLGKIPKQLFITMQFITNNSFLGFLLGMLEDR